MLEFSFEFAGTPKEVDADTRGLAHWLESAEDIDVDAKARVAPPQSGEQGGLADLLQVVVAVAPPLITLLGTWLTRRSASGPVEFTIRLSTGESESVVVTSPDQVPTVERSLRQRLQR
ncbi:hypothetical protein FE633_35630 [Streptomyces montanus]|uniref:Uncharacterized protein n=1 Tax=Streptomyces montanus TaxID=2580423 RepID=A0A5R9FCI4_9ACTN|nr:hypothetical protein [Streptomyces montanus]TLS41527.1 hypothetical protein FE633_35630 [Streptomyces montanus]